MTILILIAVLFVGVCIGALAMSMCAAGARSDERFQKAIDEYVAETPPLPDPKPHHMRKERRR